MTLECTEARKEGGTPSRYTTQKVSEHRIMDQFGGQYDVSVRKKSYHLPIQGAVLM